MPDITAKQQADAIAREPWFFPNYREPTPLARAIQMPLADPLWIDRVVGAYSRRAKREAVDA